MILACVIFSLAFALHSIALHFIYCITSIHTSRMSLCKVGRHVSIAVFSSHLRGHYQRLDPRQRSQRLRSDAILCTGLDESSEDEVSELSGPGSACPDLTTSLGPKTRCGTPSQLADTSLEFALGARLQAEKYVTSAYVTATKKAKNPMRDNAVGSGRDSCS